MKLEVTKETVFIVSTSDFEKFIKHHFNADYSVEAVWEMGHGDIEEMDVKQEYDSDTIEVIREEIKEYIADDNFQDADIWEIVSVLIADGHLETGKYFIKST